MDKNNCNENVGINQCLFPAKIVMCDYKMKENQE